MYSSIVDDITSARQQAIRNARSLAVNRNGTRARSARNDGPSRGLFTVAFDKIGPRNADSVPLPLLILGGLSLLLIAAGAAGLVSRRLRTSRAGTPAP